MDPFKGNTPEAPKPDSVSTKQERIAKLAAQIPKMSFTTLAHHIDIGWLHEAYRRTRQDGTPGVDGQTAQEYAEDLDRNLQSLLDRAKSGLYRAPAVRRVHIPKAKPGETRPIGIPTFEDKVLQRAVVMILEAVYEQDFLSCSYGFRPGRSAHQALEVLWHQAMDIRGGWILEVDIEKFFDTLDHARLREFIQQRVRDGVLIRLIGKWLNAGVLENGCLRRSSSGTPQGGVISPLLANIYLHYVVDEWFAQEVQPRLQGQAYLIRFADDLVIGFSDEVDARRVMEVLPKRLGKYGLSLNSEKTRLIPFRRPPRSSKGKGPGSFSFLGFTHYWARSRKGSWVIKRKTSPDRLRRALRSLDEWCRANRHMRINEQYHQLTQKINGHYAYYGITCNGGSLTSFWEGAKRKWKYWLGRRSNSAYRDWNWFVRFSKRCPLPRPVIVHSVYDT